jgi:CO dehydrogenase/acetyl-CoA synthase epsilon subunit
MEFIERYCDATELDDLALKIIQKFNAAFIKGAKEVGRHIDDSVEFKSFRSLKLFMKKVLDRVKSRKQ